MSEREPGFGSFVLGIAVGVALGLLLAPEPGKAVRGKLGRRLRGLRALAAEQAGALGELVAAATAPHGEDRRPRRGPARPPERLDEEDEPVG